MPDEQKGASLQGIVDQANRDVRATSSHRRFAVMDGLRGIAALAVALFHSYEGGGYIVNGQLAVDFFFILSGFVIAYSYEGRLRSSMSGRTFVASRLIRLYPMVFVGAAGGIVIALLHHVTNPADTYPLQFILIAGGLSLLVLPYLGSMVDTVPAFDFNPPIWSLFYELVANLVYILIWRRLTIPLLVAIVTAGLVAVAWAGPLGGGGKHLFYTGTGRVMAGFFGGVLLHRLWQRPGGWRPQGNVVVLSLVLLAILCIPRLIGGIWYVPVFAVECAIVLAAANALPSKLDRYSEFLGDVSYPVYLIHWLTLYVATFIGKLLGLTGPLYLVVVIAHFLALPFIGFAVGHYYEKPVRIWLNAHFLHRRDLERAARSA